MSGRWTCRFVGVFTGLCALMVSVDVSAQCVTTRSDQEGPYYRTGAPYRPNMRIPGDGPLLTLTGRVLNTQCQPIPYAWLDFWHADRAGVYDNDSPQYRYRGYQFADENGEYVLETIVPGLYPGRPAHIHVKVDAATTPMLTTQLYFPGQGGVTGLFVTAQTLPGGDMVAQFDFVLNANQPCTAPAITQQPVGATVAVGGTISLSVAGTGATPLLRQWRRNGVDLSDGGRISGAQTPTLTISDAQPQDAGAYECLLANSCGAALSAVATVVVPAGVGDLNCDGVVNFDDIDGFVIAVTGQAAYAAAYPDCEWLSGDIDGDGAVTFDDINGFVGCLTTGTCP